MKELALKYKITVAWFYGVSGHGKGLADTMSSFGCKGPLRMAIKANDAWFSCAAAMVDYLADYFEDDQTKEHYLVDPSVTAKQRRNKNKELKMNGNRKLRLIVVNKEGEFATHENFQNGYDILNLDFKTDDFVASTTDNVDKDDDHADSYHDIGAVDSGILYELHFV